METVKRLKSIKFRERVTIASKLYVSPWFRKKTDARDWKRSKLSEKDRYAVSGVMIDGSLKVDQLFEKFLISKQDKAKRTVESYESGFRCHISPIIGCLKLKDIRLFHGEQIKQRLWGLKLSAGRINDILILSKILLKFAVRQGNLALNPFDNLDKVKEIKKDIDFWTTEEVGLFLNSLKTSHYFSLFLFTLNTALRKGEVCGLMWDCVDFKNRMITVKRTRDRYGLNETTKGAEPRKIPMNKVIYEELRSLYERRKQPAYVFTKPNGEVISYEHLTDRIFNKEVERLGLRKIRFHDLRTTYSSHFCINNGNIFALSKILGHKSVKTTETYYAQINNKFLLKESERVSLSTNENLHISNVLNLESVQQEPFQNRL